MKQDSTLQKRAILGTLALLAVLAFAWRALLHKPAAAAAKSSFLISRCSKIERISATNSVSGRNPDSSPLT